MRESDDSDSDSDGGSRKTKPNIKATSTSAPVSPKQIQAKQQPPVHQEQPINLLKTSILTSQKKSPKPVISHKKIENELETALSEVSIIAFLYLVYSFVYFN